MGNCIWSGGGQCSDLCQQVRRRSVVPPALSKVPVGNPLAIPLVVGLTLTCPLDNCVCRVRGQQRWIFFICSGGDCVRCLSCIGVCVWMCGVPSACQVVEVAVSAGSDGCECRVADDEADLSLLYVGVCVVPPIF